MSPGTELLIVVGVLHAFAFGVVAALIVMMWRASDAHPPSRSEGESDGGGGSKLPTPRPRPRVGGGPPLPDATQSRVRLRDGRRLAERFAHRERRAPGHAPRRVPVSR
jgi:hypothetical protein